MTLGCGFNSLKTWIALTWSFGVIGLSTSIVRDTVLPFSTSGGTSMCTLPFFTGASPTTLRIAAFIDAGVAREGSMRITEAMPAPAMAPSSSRRVVTLIESCIVFPVSSYSRNIVRNATTSSICSAVKTGFPRKDGATRLSPSAT